MISDTVHLVLIGGLAGTGKTELSQEVVRQTGFAFYDKDLMNGPMVDEWLKALGSNASDRDSRIYLETVRPVEYACMMDAVRESIALGKSAVATAPFLKEMTDIHWRTDLQRTCNDVLGRTVSVDYVWVHTEDATMRRRLTNRGAARDRHKLANWDEYIANARKIRPVQPCFEVNCTANFETEMRAMSVIQKFHLMPGLERPSGQRPGYGPS